MENKRANDTYSLAHTSWKCQYHIVFAPKYRRKVIYGKLKAEIGAMLRELCERKHVDIIEAHAMPDHIHMLVEIPPNLGVCDFMGVLKRKKYDENIREVFKFKVQIWQPAFLGNRVLRQYSRVTGEGPEEVYSRARETGSDRGQS